MGEVLTALGPHVLWGLLLVWVLRKVGWPAVRSAMLRVKAVELGPVRVEIESGVESAAAARGVEVPEREKKMVAKRLRSAQPQLAMTRVLWIDDVPAGNKAEIGLLNGLGATIDLARGDGEARERLKGAVYDIVLSDIRRGQCRDAGIRFLPEVSDAILAPPVIFYVRESQGTPGGAFGIATRPDELMHLIVDAVERKGS